MWWSVFLLLMPRVLGSIIGVAYRVRWPLGKQVGIWLVQAIGSNSDFHSNGGVTMLITKGEINLLKCSYMGSFLYRLFMFWVLMFVISHVGSKNVSLDLTWLDLAWLDLILRNLRLDKWTTTNSIHLREVLSHCFHVQEICTCTGNCNQFSKTRVIISHCSVFPTLLSQMLQLKIQSWKIPTKWSLHLLYRSRKRFYKKKKKKTPIGAIYYSHRISWGSCSAHHLPGMLHKHGLL